MQVQAIGEGHKYQNWEFATAFLVDRGSLTSLIFDRKPRIAPSVSFLFIYLFLYPSHSLIIINKNYDVAKIINDKGCLPAGEEWLERNLLVVAGVAVGVAFLQVGFFGICT